MLSLIILYFARLWMPSRGLVFNDIHMCVVRRDWYIYIFFALFACFVHSLIVFFLFSILQSRLLFYVYFYVNKLLTKPKALILLESDSPIRKCVISTECSDVIMRSGHLRMCFSNFSIRRVHEIWSKHRAWLKNVLALLYILWYVYMYI